MGCVASVPADARRRPASIGEVAVFVPGLRLPRTVDFSQLTAAGLPEGLVDRLSALRARIVVLAAQEALVAIKPRRRRVTRHGGYVFAELRQTLEQYLPVLVGLAEDGSLRDRVKFVWANQEDDAEETAMTNAWYEVLSVLQLMAMLCLSEANMLLLPKTSSDAYQQRISDERKRKSVEIFLKAAGYLDCTIGRVLPLLPCELRSDLPVDLTEEVLQTLCIQALGQDRVGANGASDKSPPSRGQSSNTCTLQRKSVNPKSTMMSSVDGTSEQKCEVLDWRRNIIAIGRVHNDSNQTTSHRIPFNKEEVVVIVDVIYNDEAELYAPNSFAEVLNDVGVERFMKWDASLIRFV